MPHFSRPLREVGLFHCPLTEPGGAGLDSVFIRHIEASGFYATSPGCPSESIATTARDKALRSGRARPHGLPKNSVSHLISGGAALQRCDNIPILWHRL